MITFSVPKDLLLYSHEMGTPSDFSVRGFSGGQGEDGSSMTFRRMVTVSSRVALWTPAEITTALWLDAADSSTITIDSGGVSAWADKSGNGYHVTQTTSTYRPTSSNGIVFTSGKFLQNTTAKLPLPMHTSVVVFNETTSVVNAGVLSLNGTPNDWNSNDGYVIGTSNKQTNNFVSMSSRYNNTGTGLELQTTPVNACPHAIRLTAVNLASGSLYVNGSVVVTDSVSYPFTSESRGGFAIGARYINGSVNPGIFVGYIREILWIDTVNTFILQKIEGYLAHKWDALLRQTTLVDALPSDHPYKSAAPTIQPG